jgi:hypothetical protein
MLIPNKFNGYQRDGTRLLHISMGGGGGGPTQTTSTVQNTNIPEYAKGYVENMLGATQKQLFQGNTDESGNFNITGFKPYQAYGGTYDKQGNQLSYDPSKAIAGFQPMQEKAQRGVNAMQVPEQYRQAMGITNKSISGALGTADQGMGLSNMGYNAAGAGDRYAQQATNPYATQAYMSPYMQNVVDVQNREAMRNAGILGTQQQADATKSGAFGGSRDAIMRAERERNLSTQMNQNQAQGLQNAFQQAQSAQQFGANLGLQGMQAGMQGVGAGINAQQAAYNQAMMGGQNLANLGQQRQTAQQNIYNMQNQFGGQQQAMEQAKINQAMQDYANAQQYPLMQLGTMSNMLRGLPMQASTTNQYAASPNPLSQAVGTIGSAASIYNAYNPTRPGGAAGGLPKEFKYSSGGGIMSYDMGGEVESQLESMGEEELARQAKESSSPSIRKMAQRILRERQMGDQSGGASATDVQYQAPQPQMPAMRGGGIIAFKTGAGGDGSKSAIEEGGEDEAKIDMEKRLAQPAPTDGGIMGAAPTTVTPTTQVPVVPQSAKAIQGASMPEFMKAQYADTMAEVNKPLSERVAEESALRKQMGIADVAEGQQKQRENLMAEKANMGAENERQRNMRMAEFFAKWGSTPGPVLVAGMNALKESVPTIISDEKEAKKANRDIDKSIADIDLAMRAEKLGQMGRAMDLREKAVDRMKSLQTSLITYQAHRETNEANVEGHRITAKGALDAALVRAGSDKSYRVQQEQHQNENRVYNAYQAASRELDNVRATIQKQESSDVHKEDLKKLEKYTMGAVNPKTKEFDESKINPLYKTQYKETLNRISKRQEGWNNMLQDAENDKNMALNRVKTLNATTSDTKVEKNKPTSVVADSGEGVTGHFKSPTASQIERLKKFPGKAEEFDKNFGPGAAKEYLGNQNG